MQSSSDYTRFAFDKFNSEKWSLEHIHAQNDSGINKLEQQKEWLKNTKEFIKDSKILNKIEKFLSSKDKADDEFGELQRKIFKATGDDGQDIHTIDNLALLSHSANSSLGNQIFPFKRNAIIDKDKKASLFRFAPKMFS
ncbi:hypothetical protein [Campylobacter majalis]|uniref:hypothetical protein n=1 Tax=Campylobacter majalis TaxID=2790656 RepID=UPI003D69D2F2